MTPAFRLSVAIPVLNEETVLAEMLRRVRSVLDELAGGPHEIVFVDDGSRDQTPAIVAQMSQQHPVKLIRFSRNFGKELAIAAGLNHSTGDLGREPGQGQRREGLPD